MAHTLPGHTGTHQERKDAERHRRSNIRRAVIEDYLDDDLPPTFGEAEASRRHGRFPGSTDG